MEHARRRSQTGWGPDPSSSLTSFAAMDKSPACCVPPFPLLQKKANHRCEDAMRCFDIKLLPGIRQAPNIIPKGSWSPHCPHELHGEGRKESVFLLPAHTTRLTPVSPEPPIKLCMYKYIQLHNILTAPPGEHHLISLCSFLLIDHDAKIFLCKQMLFPHHEVCVLRGGGGGAGSDFVKHMFPRPGLPLYCL